MEANERQRQTGILRQRVRDKMDRDFHREERRNRQIRQADGEAERETEREKERDRTEIKHRQS